MAGVRVEVRGPKVDGKPIDMYERLATMTIHFDGEEIQRRAAQFFAEMEQDEETSKRAGALFGAGIAFVIHEFNEQEKIKNADNEAG